MVAQVPGALDHIPDGFFRRSPSCGTRPVRGPGRATRDLPDHDGRRMTAVLSSHCRDWSDQAVPWRSSPLARRDRSATTAAAAHARGRALLGPGTPGIPSPRSRWLTRWACLLQARLQAALARALAPGSRSRTRDSRSAGPVLPVGNGEALAREIPVARLVVLEHAATVIPRRGAGDVAAAMLDL